MMTKAFAGFVFVAGIIAFMPTSSAALYDPPHPDPMPTDGCWKFQDQRCCLHPAVAWPTYPCGCPILDTGLFDVQWNIPGHSQGGRRT